MSNEDHQQGRFPEPPDHQDRHGGPDGGQGRLDLPDAFVQDGPHEYPQSGDQGYAAGAQEDYQGYQDHGQGQAHDHGQGFPYEYGGWQPTAPDYDGEATGFFQLPTEDSPAAAPLEAPGHGYVPPMIMPLTPLAPEAGVDLAADGGWAPEQPQAAGERAEPSAAAPEPVQWPEAGAQRHGDPHATGQWTFPEEPAPAAAHDPAGHEMTGQWSIPIAEGDLPDESGEFLRSAPPVAETPWAAAEPPATLPGGAPAPWTTLPGGAPAPWAEQVPQEQAPQEAAVHQPEPGEAAPEGPAPAEPGHAAPEPQDAPEPASPETAQVPDPREDRPVPQEHAAAQPSGDASDASPEEPPTGDPSSEDAPSGEPDSGAAAATGADEHPPTSYVLRVNGTDRPVTDAWIGESLLYVLRERLGLAGAKDGCSQGECGACNVQVDGRLVASCLVPAATAAGSEVRTVEGLAGDGEPSDVQRALANCGAVQCGFCIPGMAMTVHDLLEGNHAPTELETRKALCGNLCRCSGYRGVLDAVREVVAERAASAAAAAEEAPPESYGEAHEDARIPHQAPPGAGRVQAHPHDGGMA
ncbi:2Fe-2S iron-sulfur cluster-binding protein [Streptomyces sp. PKU-EA00015]|uniref:2Fe-2S iron-sulfur cluster-binding protein n=1 Tax=Streptomyces sp. PKU-EA00015 TaxID=2748326 RepID=UPI002811DE9E|nr:2Fe-2S iron-sulfur cluster-binding protein [Streptomyces sp. PKU-EA00015]